MSHATLDRLSSEIRENPELWRQFDNVTDVDELVEKTLDLAHARGYDDLDEEAVESYILDAANREALSEEELEQAAGGACCSSVLSCCCC